MAVTLERLSEGTYSFWLTNAAVDEDARLLTFAILKQTIELELHCKKSNRCYIVIKPSSGESTAVYVKKSELQRKLLFTPEQIKANGRDITPLIGELIKTRTRDTLLEMFPESVQESHDDCDSYILNFEAEKRDEKIGFFSFIHYLNWKRVYFFYCDKNKQGIYYHVQFESNGQLKLVRAGHADILLASVDHFVTWMKDTINSQTRFNAEAICNLCLYRNNLNLNNLKDHFTNTSSPTLLIGPNNAHSGVTVWINKAGKMVKPITFRQESESLTSTLAEIGEVNSWKKFETTLLDLSITTGMNALGTEAYIEYEKVDKRLTDTYEALIRLNGHDKLYIYTFVKNSEDCYYLKIKSKDKNLQYGVRLDLNTGNFHFEPERTLDTDSLLHKPTPHPSLHFILYTIVGMENKNNLLSLVNAEKIIQTHLPTRTTPLQ